MILACERLLPSANQPLNVAIPNFPILNGSFHQQQSFKLVGKPFCEGLESAKSDRRLSTCMIKAIDELLKLGRTVASGARVLDIFSPPREEYKMAGDGFASRRADMKEVSC
jgi:hypothetical protein